MSGCSGYRKWEEESVCKLQEDITYNGVKERKSKVHAESEQSNH